MDTLTRLTALTAPLLVASLTFGQQTKPTSQGSQPSSQSSSLDQEVTGIEETSKDREKKLESELAKLDSELNMLKQIESSGGMIARITRSIQSRTSEVGAFSPPLPAAPTGGSFRVMTEAEKAQHGAGTMLLVNGNPVSTGEFNQLQSFIQQWQPDADAAGQQALLEAIKESVAYHADKAVSDANRERLQGVLNRLLELSPFEKECAEVSEGPRAKNGGDLGKLGIRDANPRFMSQVLSLEPGDRSPILKSPEGFHYVECMGLEGAGQNRKTHLRQIMVRYSDKAIQAAMQAAQGKVELAFRDQQYIRFAPGTKSMGDDSKFK